MNQATTEATDHRYRWVLFFYAVPSTPVSNRMKLWRRLMKAGAMPLKGAVYILPYSHEHYEFLQWLVAEVAAMKGEAAVVRIDQIDTIPDAEIIELFNQARDESYLALERASEEITRKLHAIKKGGQGQGKRGVAGHLDRVRKALAETRRIDFFVTAQGRALQQKIDSLGAEIAALPGQRGKAPPPVAVSRRAAADYQGRVWITRKRPFVDRMASAWLIRRFIDPAATFQFVDEGERAAMAPGAVLFDLFGGEFTHAGDLCTFEVLRKAFGLKEGALAKMAEIVHDLDIKDDKYHAPEAQGLEAILMGISKTVPDDRAALEQGMAIFEMLYRAQKS